MSTQVKTVARINTKPPGFEVVDSLCSHYDNRHHFFLNAVEAAEHLINRETYMCGTIRTNRRGLPQSDKKNLKQGEKF